MSARPALAEGGTPYDAVPMDIHLRRDQHAPDYARFNPHMSVPTLVLTDRILDESHAIAGYALGVEEGGFSPATREWLDRHYAFPIEELTFGTILARNPVARFAIPRRLAAIQRDLLRRAVANPDLASAYRERAAVFAERVRVFDPAAAAQLSRRRQGEVRGFLDQMDEALADGREFLAPGAYGVADVVWTVFLARMEFVGLGEEMKRRPALAAYWARMQVRPSFAAAEIWTSVHPLRLIAGMLGLSKLAPKTAA